MSGPTLRQLLPLIGIEIDTGWIVAADVQHHHRARFHRCDRLAHGWKVGAGNIVAEHEEIMRSVIGRDKERSVALITTHLRATANAVARLLGKGWAPAPPPTAPQVGIAIDERNWGGVGRSVAPIPRLT